MFLAKEYNAPMSIVIESAEHLDRVVQETEGTLVVDFWAVWCGPCRAVSPILESMEADGEITLAKLDVDSLPDVAESFGVTSIPLMQVYKDGVLARNIIGAKPKHVLQAQILNPAAKSQFDIRF